MKILIEGHNYDAGRVEKYVAGLQPLANVAGEVSVSYVGYFYNVQLKDCIFILPKVLLNEQERIFVSESRPEGFDPDDIIDFDENKKLTEDERRFIYEFAVWIYRAIVVYKNDRDKERDTNSDYKDIIYTSKVTEAGRGRKHKSRTFLDILITMVHFNRENQNFFMQVLRNQHKGLNKINWAKTVTRSSAIIDKDTPVYLNPINKKRQINFDEELLIIFFSILNYINETYGFPIVLNLGYELIKGPQFKQLMAGRGIRRLRQIKYKYFSDKALQIWELCYAFFSRTAVQVTSHIQEYLLAKNFEIVFEGIIDTLIGDKGETAKLKNQKDGKIIDHLFKHKSLTTHESDKDIYYIGDSKYYKIGGDIGSNSIYKQYTYARNLIQWNINLFHDSKDSLRDNITEGYNIIPNFFISAKLTDGLKYTDHVERRAETHMQAHFPNRLFDRDTLLISHYDVNFLFVISLYARNNASQRATWRDKVRDKFREEIQSMLEQHFDFYAMTAREGVNAQEYLKTHFQDTLGKVFKPYDKEGYYSLALDKSPDFKDENDRLLAELDRVFHVCHLKKMGADPTPVLVEAVSSASGEVVKPIETDMALLIMFDNVHDMAGRQFTKIAQGLSLSESALRITADLSLVKYIVLHNKRDYYVYRTMAAPRLASKKAIGEDVLCKLKDEELFVVFDVDPTPIADVEIVASKLAVAKGDDRISYYSTILPFSKLI